MYTGVALSITATSLFAGMYFYATLLQPLNGEAIFGLRMVVTLPVVTLLMAATREWPRVVDVACRVRAKPSLLVPLACSSGLLGIQQWLFMWAPLNGSAVQVSLGYFLLPLSMLAVGRFLYGEKLSLLKLAAALLAAAGVAHAVVQAGGLSWEALTVCIGFPTYFVLRKSICTDHLGGLWFDMLLSIPVAAWMILRQPELVSSFSGRAALYPLVTLLGVGNAVAYMCYIAASRRLTLGSFGLLGYGEPVLMVAVAILLGERIADQERWTFFPIWIATVLLVADGIRHLRVTNLSLSNPATAGPNSPATSLASDLLDRLRRTACQ